MSDPNVETGKQAAQAGNLEEAANYMAAAVQADPGNEEAWLLFGDYLTDPEKRQFCYQRVLEINPANPLARAGLDSLEDDLPLTPLAPAEPTWLQTEPLPTESSPAPTLLHVPAETSPDNQPTLPPTLEPPFEPAHFEEAQPEGPPASSRATLVHFPPAQPENTPAERQPWHMAQRDDDHSRQKNSEGAAVTLVATHDWHPDEQTEEQPKEWLPEPVEEPQQPATPAQTVARPERPRPTRRKRSPLRFLLFIFPLMLLALIGMLIAPIYWILILR